MRGQGTEHTTVCLTGFPGEEAERLAGLLQRAGLDALICAGGCRQGECQRGDMPGCVLVNVAEGTDLVALSGARTGPGDCPGVAPLVAMLERPEVGPVVQLLRHGAWDVLRPPVSDQLLLDTVCQAVQVGQAQLDEYRACQRLQARLGRLTRRELEVFSALARGGSHREIAEVLGISPRTLEVHRARLYRKLRIETYTELVRMAVSAGVLERYPLLPEVDPLPNGPADQPS